MASSTARSPIRAPARSTSTRSGPSGDNSLTAAELAVVKGMYGGTRSRIGRAALPGREARLRERLDSALRRQRRLRRVHRALRVLAQYAAVRLAARAQLRRTSTTKRRRSSRRSPRRRARTSRAFVEPRRQADPVSRLERLGRAARRLDRLPVRAHAIRAVPQPAEGRVRSRDRHADCRRTSRRRPNRCSRRSASTIGCSWCRRWATAR